MEMMKLLSGLDLNKYTPRTYVLAQTDRISESKISALEKTSETATPSVNVCAKPDS